MLIFNNNRVTHVYKGTELVDLIRWGNDVIFPYNADDKYEFNILHTDLGYSIKYLKLLNRAGFDLDNIDVNAIDEVKTAFADVDLLSWTAIPNNKHKYMPGIIYSRPGGYNTGANLILTIDLSNTSATELTSLYRMFFMWSNLVAVDLSNFDTSNITDMSYMFYGCSSLGSLDLSNFDTSNVTNMGLMFSSCSSLTYIRCKQAFKDWCIENQSTIYLPSKMREGGTGTWDIIDN